MIAKQLRNRETGTKRTINHLGVLALKPILETHNIDPRYWRALVKQRVVTSSFPDGRWILTSRKNYQNNPNVIAIITKLKPILTQANKAFLPLGSRVVINPLKLPLPPWW